jgi:cellulose synthase/poly-beta-1,6-N-acetylglucosamine synthase-like glycosyltransferase
MLSVSIIIPTLNEATCLERTLRRLTLLNPPAREVLVVDGGSEDETVVTAKRNLELFSAPTQAKVISCTISRGARGDQNLNTKRIGF